MKKIVQILIKILTIISIVICGIYIYNICTGTVDIDNLIEVLTTWYVIIPFLLLMVISHGLRMFRIYILLMEKRIKIKKLIPIYLSTTFVNNLLPFKSGEIYKALVYGEKLNDPYNGILIVWVDRFFDTVIMCLFSILLIIQGEIPNILIILYLFVLITILIYGMFYNTYLYFSKMLLIKGKTKKSALYLSILNKARILFFHAKELVRGRALILLILSLIIWITEYVMILSIFNMFGIAFNPSEFFTYLNQSFFINSPNNIYSTILMLNILTQFVFVIICSITNLKGEKNERKDIVHI